jgi:hypothetical protein
MSANHQNAPAEAVIATEVMTARLISFVHSTAVNVQFQSAKVPRRTISSEIKLSTKIKLTHYWRGLTLAAAARLSTSRLPSLT